MKQRATITLIPGDVPTVGRCVIGTTTDHPTGVGQRGNAIITTKIVRVDGNEFETLNTIYTIKEAAK